jgi:hypothetical protein
MYFISSSTHTCNQCNHTVLINPLQAKLFKQSSFLYVTPCHGKPNAAACTDSLIVQSACCTLFFAQQQGYRLKGRFRRVCCCTHCIIRGAPTPASTGTQPCFTDNCVMQHCWNPCTFFRQLCPGSAAHMLHLTAVFRVHTPRWFVPDAISYI